MRTKLLTIDDVEKTYGLKKSRIRYLVFARQIPFIKIGRSVFFQGSDLEQWLKSKQFFHRK